MEHKVIVISINQVEEVLNAAAKGGWQLVTVIPHGDLGINCVVFLQRPTS